MKLQIFIMRDGLVSHESKPDNWNPPHSIRHVLPPKHILRSGEAEELCELVPECREYSLIERNGRIFVYSELE